MPDNSSRNTVIFMILAGVILFGYQFLVIDPMTRKKQAEQARAKAEQVQPGALPGAPDGRRPVVRVSRAQAIAATPRVPIQTGALSGSIALRGGRFDDLWLKDFRQSLESRNPVELLRPEGVDLAYFTELGWSGANVPGLPTADTLWTAQPGASLGVGAPVTLTYDNGAGLRFTRVIAVDEHYLFTVTDTVANLTAAPVTLAPYGSVQRQGVPADAGKNTIVHEGAIGMLGEKPKLELIKYPKWKKNRTRFEAETPGGWLGLTDKYWLAALIPDQKETITGQFRVTAIGETQVYEANFVGQPRTIGPGRQVTETTRLFAGAKQVPLLQAYEKSLNVPRFDYAVDWGMFHFLTRPLFMLLSFFYQHVFNFGLAIMALTVLVKLVFFPLQNKSYESITKMKKLQPQMEEIKAKHGKDPAKMQQETMALYQREKVNPLMGCLPVLIQIPVFYSLYKVLTVTIEMRHAPFYGWIQDLSAPDPTSIWNLFGLLPFDPAMVPLIGGLLGGPLHVGAWLVIYGFTMWLTQAMNPPMPDPMQQRIFSFLPLIFTFLLSTMAVGLVIYWTWNNLLSIVQQYVMMRRYKVDNPIDRMIGKLTGKEKALG